MPITHNARAPNGITVAYHKAVKLEVDLVNNVATVAVQSYTNEEAYLDKLSIAWMWTINVPTEYLAGNGTVLEDVENALVTIESSPFLDGSVQADATISLEALKLKKNAEINRARLQANQSHFMFSGKEIAFDQLSFIDIISANGEIALTGQLPAGWLGGWKAKDNSIVAIPNVATWTTFYKAMVQQGQENFLRAQTLKAQLNAATSAEEIATIQW